MQTYYLSGSTLPWPASFGIGVSGFLIGDAASGLWNFQTGGVTLAQSGASRPTYIFASGAALTVSVVDYGLLLLDTLGDPVTGVPLSGGPYFSAVQNTQGTFGINISGQANNSSYSGISLGAPFWGGESQGQGTAFYGVMGSGGFGEVVFLSSASVTTGITGCPSGMAQISCLAVLPSSSAVILGGWGAGVFASGATAFAISPTTGVGLAFAGAISGGTIMAWETPSGTPGLWSQISSLSGQGFGESLGIGFFSPVSAVVADGGGTLWNFSYIGGTITQTQQTSVSGIGPYVATLGTGVALVPQPSTSSVLGFTLIGNTWTLSGTVLTGVALPTDIQSQGASALAGFQSGFALIDPAFVKSGILGFNPQVITSDQFGNYFLAGNGAVALVSQSGVLISSGVIDATHPPILGNAYNQGQYYYNTSAYVAALEYQNGFKLISSAAASGLGQSLVLGTQWTQASGTPTLSGILWGQDSLLVPSNMGIYEIEWVAPFQMDYRRAGVSVIYSGGYGAISGLGIGTTPCQACTDSSGNPRLSTLEGYLLLLSGNTISSSAQIWSGGGGLVGLVSGAPGTLWGATALNAAVVMAS